MFRNRSRNFVLTSILLSAVFLALPCSLPAQRGAGGGHTGGGLAGGGGLSGGGGPGSGLDVKDDLKDFHETLALQATSQQVIDYKAMIAATDNAGAELKSFLTVANEANAATLAVQDKNLIHAFQLALTSNASFLQKLSDRQKNGLKETVKKLDKAESELTQQTKALDLQVEEAKSGGPQIAASAQNLERSLATFRGQQIDLGGEMSIGGAAGDQGVILTLHPVKSSINFSGRDVEIITSGAISKAVLQTVPDTFHLEMIADMSDLQRNLSQVLRAQLDRSDSCGEQLAIRTAVLSSSGSASLAQVQLHYERWSCFGKGISNEMVEGEGTVFVKLTPSIADDGTLHLVPIITRVDAPGAVGEQLKSGSLGETVRDKVSDSLLAIILRATDYKTVLPAPAQGKVTLRNARFEGTGTGKVSMILDGEILISHDSLTALANQLRSGEIQAPAPQSAPR
jgi:hypothetical protein